MYSSIRQPAAIFHYLVKYKLFFIVKKQQSQTELQTRRWAVMSWMALNELIWVFSQIDVRVLDLQWQLHGSCLIWLSGHTIWLRAEMTSNQQNI